MRTWRIGETLLERFIRYVVKTDGCWQWIGHRGNTYGHGKFRMGSKKEFSHRASWKIFRGEIPEGLCVCHSCDNPSCVNPEHLWLGTIRDNHLDMVKKGRQKFNMHMTRDTFRKGSRPGPKPKIREKTLTNGGH